MLLANVGFVPNTRELTSVPLKRRHTRLFPPRFAHIFDVARSFPHTPVARNMGWPNGCDSPACVVAHPCPKLARAIRPLSVLTPDTELLDS